MEDAPAWHGRRNEQVYSSFLIRCWTLGGDRTRIKVEHVQDGEWTHVEAFEDALEWIRVRCRTESRREDHMQT